MVIFASLSRLLLFPSLQRKFPWLSISSSTNIIPTDIVLRGSFNLDPSQWRGPSQNENNCIVDTKCVIFDLHECYLLLTLTKKLANLSLERGISSMVAVAKMGKSWTGTLKNTRPLLINITVVVSADVRSRGTLHSSDTSPKIKNG